MPKSEAGYSPFLGRLQHVGVNSWNAANLVGKLSGY
jgi:hypothetical protein